VCRRVASMGVFIGGVHGGVCPGGVPCANACNPGDETCADDVVARDVAASAPRRACNWV